jgi:RimJ/RimL family protein N-acetyltransferase
MDRTEESILETERLLFRNHVEADLEPFCEIEADPEYRWPQKVHPRAELERSFRECWMLPKPMGLLAAVLKPENRYIGRCGLYPNRGENNVVIPGEAQLAFYLARPYWGRGLATEASRAFIQRGFGVLGLSRIEASANADNAASNRVLQKLGFKLIRSGHGGGSFWHDYELRNPSA